MANIFTVTMAPVSPPYDDGPKNIVIGIARRLNTHRFYFVSSFKNIFSECDNIDFIRSPFQKTGGYAMPALQKLFIFFIIIFKIKKIDIFQFFFTPRPYFSKIFGRMINLYHKRSIQVVSSVHTLLANNRKEMMPSLFFSDYVVVHSEYSKRIFLEAGVKNVVRIYPGIELSRFQPGGSGREGRNLSENTQSIIYPGTYKALKESYSLEDFCKIAMNIREKAKNINFIMACRIRTKQERCLEDDFRKLIDRHGLGPCFSLLNTVENIPALFGSATIGIFPARKPMAGILEIPLVLLEMAYLGKPVIYGSVPPLEELSEKGLGIRVEDSSPEAYADEALRILHDEKLALAIGQRSRRAVSDYFNMESLAYEYGKLYDSLSIRV